MTVEDYQKLLDAEGLFISNIEEGRIYCSPYSFEKTEYGWDGKRSARLEDEWRKRLSHISEQIDFFYDEFPEGKVIYSTFELSLYIGEIEKDKMTIQEGVEEVLEVEKETGLFIPVCWNKEDVEERLEQSISDEDWRDAARLVDKHADFSSQVIEAIDSALDEFD